MKVKILQHKLNEVLGIVGRAVSTRSSLPILENVLFAVDDGRLKLAATNLEIAIIALTDGKIEGSGAITIPRKTIADFVKLLPDEPVTLELIEATMAMHLSCGKFSAEIKGITAEEFPLLPEINESAELEIETAELLKILDRVTFSAASEDSRPTLTGVYISVREDRVTMAATDGFRLSEAQTHLKSYPENNEFIRIVPARALQELARIAKDEETVSIFLPTDSDSRIFFRAGDVTVFSHVIDGMFPEYASVIPSKSKTTATIEVGRFVNAVKLANVFARESAHTINLALWPSDNGSGEGKIVVSGQNTETGDQQSEMPATIDGDGEELDITVNALYLKEALEAMRQPQATLYFTSKVEPLVLRPHGDESEDFLHVVMPMQFGR